MTRPTILVIEEDPDLSRLFEAILQIEGYAVLLETRLDNARRTIGHTALDAIVFDWAVANPSGYFWLDEVRSIPEHSGLPILLVCDMQPPREMREALGNLGVPMIEKPFDLMVFCRALEGLLPLRERAVGV